MEVVRIVQNIQAGSQFAMGRNARIVCACAFAATTRDAFADVYTYVGSDKVTVLTNSVPQNQRVEVLVVERVVLRSLPAAARDDAGRGKRFDEMIDAAAQTFGIDGALLHAVIAVESGYNVQARSRRGASGLMQLMPATARQFGAADVFDPVQNINGGARYLKYLLDKYDNRLDIVLAAYNAGEKALLKYGKTVPPFKETVQYVEQVQARYQRYRGVQEAAASATPDAE